MHEINAELQHKISRQRRLLTPARRADTAVLFRARMVEKQLKNVDIAERLGVSEANVSRWLRGDQNLSLDTVHAISDALGDNLVLALQAPADCSWQQEGADLLSKAAACSADVRDIGMYRALKLRKVAFTRPQSEVVEGRSNGDGNVRTSAVG